MITELGATGLRQPRHFWHHGARSRSDSVSEIFFVVEESPEGGYVARAASDSIVTQADTVEDLRDQVRDAVRCHFEPGSLPRIIRLHFVRDEIIAA